MQLPEGLAAGDMADCVHGKVRVQKRKSSVRETNPRQHRCCNNSWQSDFLYHLLIVTCIIISGLEIRTGLRPVQAMRPYFPATSSYQTKDPVPEVLVFNQVRTSSASGPPIMRCEPHFMDDLGNNYRPRADDKQSGQYPGKIIFM